MHCFSSQYEYLFCLQKMRARDPTGHALRSETDDVRNDVPWKRPYPRVLRFFVVLSVSYHVLFSINLTCIQRRYADLWRPNELRFLREFPCDIQRDIKRAKEYSDPQSLLDSHTTLYKSCFITKRQGDPTHLQGWRQGSLHFEVQTNVTFIFYILILDLLREYCF